ncbi:MAG: cupin domain-containing protein [Desulfonatronovibrionaceae bacterium]
MHSSKQEAPGLQVIRIRQGYEQEWNDLEKGRIKWENLLETGSDGHEGLTAGKAALEPGREFRPHIHNIPELYYISAGQGQLICAENRILVKAETLVHIPAGTVHGLLNTGQTTLNFLYIFQAGSFDRVSYDFL